MSLTAPTDAALRLPSITELGLLPLATAAQVVDAVINEMKRMWFSVSRRADIVFSIRQSDMQWSLRECDGGALVCLPANWTDIVRRAAEGTYEVAVTADAVTLSLRRSDPDAAVSCDLPSLPRPDEFLPILTDAELVERAAEEIVNRMSAVFTLRYDDIDLTRRPPWPRVRDVLVRAAAPSWSAEVRRRALDRDANRAG
jgi:hypothetical protein